MDWFTESVFYDVRPCQFNTIKSQDGSPGECGSLLPANVSSQRLTCFSNVTMRHLADFDDLNISSWLYPRFCQMRLRSQFA